MFHSYYLDDLVSLLIIQFIDNMSTRKGGHCLQGQVLEQRIFLLLPMARRCDGTIRRRNENTQGLTPAGSLVLPKVSEHNFWFNNGCITWFVTHVIIWFVTGFVTRLVTWLITWFVSGLVTGFITWFVTGFTGFITGFITWAFGPHLIGESRCV